MWQGRVSGAERRGASGRGLRRRRCRSARVAMARRGAAAARRQPSASASAHWPRRSADGSEL